ncbi:Potassium transporter, partial [Stylosanthes scabra]|nr:Potassium transporter [Stylosanthes scabra]
MDSTESRWVFQEDEDDASEIEEYEADLRHHHSVLDSDDEDNGEQRLVRTGPRIDSFDVEALEVPGVQRNDFEVTSR